jgi:hypothetical protein
MAVRRLSGDGAEITHSVWKRDSSVAKANAKWAQRADFTQVNEGGTAAAKGCVMLTLSAFVIALGSVFTSVVWACKEDMVDRA